MLHQEQQHGQHTIRNPTRKHQCFNTCPNQTRNEQHQNPDINQNQQIQQINSQIQPRRQQHKKQLTHAREKRPLHQTHPETHQSRTS